MRLPFASGGSGRASRHRSRGPVAAKPLSAFIAVMLSLLLVFVALAPSPASGAKYAFETEVQKVMNIIISSLYKTKDVFLRELISNASDAIEKMRTLTISDPKALQLPSLSDFNITIFSDPEHKTLVITDNGIGMTKEELQKNLGTVAKSGTAEFIRMHSEASEDAASQASRSSLIGQFGVGFYSAFLVAEKVEVYSKHPKEKKLHVWSSNVKDGFTIEEPSEEHALYTPDIPHGTRIVLYLNKDAAEEFTKYKRLGRLIRRFSEFAPHPIYLNITREVEEEVPVEEDADETKSAKESETDKEEGSSSESEEEEEEDDNGEDSKKKDGEKEKKPRTKKVKTIKTEMRHVNAQPPIWLRNPKEVPKKDHDAFFRKTFRQHSDPVHTVHFHGEGSMSFTLLFYIPPRPQHSVMNLVPEKYVHNVRLYVRRVLITNELVGFLPRFLGFVRGIIDSNDFQLNVARETLQNNAMLGRIKKAAISKILASIHEISRNTTEYKPFYKKFQEYIKVGILENGGSDSTSESTRNRLTELLRFASTYNATAETSNTDKKEKKDGESDDEDDGDDDSDRKKSDPSFVSLKEYVSRMRKNQSAIYYLTGLEVRDMGKSNYAESLIRRGYEVLLMEDSMDPHVAGAIRQYAGYKLQDVAQGDLDFGDEDDSARAEHEELVTRFMPLTTWLTNTLNNSISKASVSKRLTDSACALVAPEHGWTGRMQSLMSSQKSDPMTAYFATIKMNFEINPRHPIMMSLLAKIEAEAVDDEVIEQAHALYDIALISGGFPIPDVPTLVRRMETNVRHVLGVDMSSKADINLRPAPEVAATASSSTDETNKEAATDDSDHHDDDITREEEEAENPYTEDASHGDDLGHFEL